MAALEVIALDEATPQLRAPGGTDSYLMKKDLTFTRGAFAMLGTSDAYGLGFKTAGTERARIDETGRFGIGQNAPSARLHVTDTTGAGSGALAASAGLFEQTWNTTGAPVALSVAVTDTASNAASLLADFKVGGISKANVQKDGQVNGVYFFATGGIFYETTNGFRSDGTGAYVGSNKFLGW